MSIEETMYDIQSTPQPLGVAELVAIVRCKNCIHRPTGYEEPENLRYPIFPDTVCPCRIYGDEWYSWIPDPNWFCPNGEAEK